MELLSLFWIMAADWARSSVLNFRPSSWAWSGRVVRMSTFATLAVPKASSPRHPGSRDDVALLLTCLAPGPVSAPPGDSERGGKADQGQSSGPRRPPGIGRGESPSRRPNSSPGCR
ncbi:hypothetical protein STENM327S_07759 [Streptomyces tendae]